jgi:hypothetical protein
MYRQTMNWFFARLIFDLENGGDTFLRNVGSYIVHTMTVFHWLNVLFGLKTIRRTTTLFICKESSIISWTGVAIWSKTNLGTSGQCHPRRRPFSWVCTVPSDSVMIWMHPVSRGVCEGVQHRLRFCIDHFCRIHREISSDPGVLHFVHWLSRYTIIINYICIGLLQLL